MSEREKQRKRVAERITEALDIPPDILSGESLIEIRGRGSVVVHGCRRILVYLPERIELSLHRGGVAIEGEGMCFVSFSAGSVGIEGRIKGVSILEDI